MLTQVDDPMYHGEYQPNQSEFIATSIFGIFLFFGILSVSGLILLSNWKRLCATTRIFYISMVMMAAFDLPRYFSLAVEKDYISVEVYAMHIISGIFYFICLSTVGFSFVYILELGSYMSLLYSKWGLAIAIAIHSAIDLTAFGLCLRSSSLASFFSSFYYRVFITFDITQNLLYSCVLAGFGVKIIYRFRNLGRCSTDVVQRKVFEGVVRKVTIVLSFLCSFSFIRLVLLGVKTSSLQNIENEELVTTVSVNCNMRSCSILILNRRIRSILLLHKQ